MLKFKNKLINFFYLSFRVLHGQQLYNDHDVMCCLPYTVVTAASPTTPLPLLDDVANCAVNNS